MFSERGILLKGGARGRGAMGCSRDDRGQQTRLRKSRVRLDSNFGAQPLPRKTRPNDISSLRFVCNLSLSFFFIHDLESSCIRPAMEINQQ